MTTGLVPNRYERRDDAAREEPLGRSFSVRLIALVFAISDVFEDPLFKNEPIVPANEASTTTITVATTPKCRLRRITRPPWSLIIWRSESKSFNDEVLQQ